MRKMQYRVILDGRHDFRVELSKEQWEALTEKDFSKGNLVVSNAIVPRNKIIFIYEIEDGKE